MVDHSRKGWHSTVARVCNLAEGVMVDSNLNTLAWIQEICNTLGSCVREVLISRSKQLRDKPC